MKKIFNFSHLYILSITSILDVFMERTVLLKNLARYRSENNFV